MTRAQAASTSTTKSRSLTASRLFCEIDAKSSSLATISRFSARLLPVAAPDPRGMTSARA